MNTSRLSTGSCLLPAVANWELERLWDAYCQTSNRYFFSVSLGKLWCDLIEKEIRRREEHYRPLEATSISPDFEGVGSIDLAASVGCLREMEQRFDCGAGNQFIRELSDVYLQRFLNQFEKFSDTLVGNDELREGAIDFCFAEDV